MPPELQSPLQPHPRRLPEGAEIVLESVNRTYRGRHGADVPALADVSLRVSHGELLDAIRWTTHRGGKPVDQCEALPPERVQPLDTVLARARADGVDVRVVSAAGSRSRVHVATISKANLFQGCRY